MRESMLIVDVHNRNLPFAPEPTSTPIGSPERVEVMRQRAEAGYAVTHPGDDNSVSGSVQNLSATGDRRKVYPLCQNEACRRKYAMRVIVQGKVSHLCGGCLKAAGAVVNWLGRR